MKNTKHIKVTLKNLSLGGPGKYQIVSLVNAITVNIRDGSETRVRDYLTEVEAKEMAARKDHTVTVI